MPASGFPELTYAGALSRPTRQELEAMVSLLQGWLSVDHAADGHHVDVIAQTCTSANGYWEFGRRFGMFQGEDVNYDPSIYSANGAMTWAPTAAQQVFLRAARAGSFLSYIGLIDGTNVGGVADTQLRIKLPYNLKVRQRSAMTSAYNDAGGAGSIGFCSGFPGDDFLVITKIPGANWTITAANNTTVQFTWFGEVYE